MVRREFLVDLGRGISTIVTLTLLDGCERNILKPLVSGMQVPFLTDVDSFFVQNGAQAAIPNWQMPLLDAATFGVRVDGLVNAPRTFRLDEIKGLAAPGEELMFLKTLQCVFEAPLLSSPTGLTGNAYWTGVPLSRVLAAAGGVRPEAVRLRFFGADGFRNNIRIDRLAASASDLLPPALVYAMNDRPLTPEHGAPLRLILPEGYGFKSVKWLTGIEATAVDDAFGTYQDNGFTDAGVLAVTSRTTRPLANAGLHAGSVEVAGVALSGAAGIDKVEIRIDGGPWESAEILPPGALEMKDTVPWAKMEQMKRSLSYPFRGVWTLWRATWVATPGSHTLEVRATDTTGAVQPETDRDLTDGTNAIATIGILVT